MKMKQVHTLVLGAGISGLSYANFCKEPYLIVEKELSPGGYAEHFMKERTIFGIILDIFFILHSRS